MYPFGESGADDIRKIFGIQNTFSLPLEAEASRCADSGIPFLESDTPSKASAEVLFDDLARGIAEELDALESSAAAPTVNYVEGRGIVARFFDADGASEYVIPPVELRRRVSSVDKMMSIDPSSVQDDITPLHIEVQGNYAVAISWSDGSERMYTYDQIRGVGKALE